MTPTKQDKELREKINHRFESVCTEGHQQSCGEYQTAVDDIMQLITADRKRVALEARIELIDSMLNSNPGILHDCGRRLDGVFGKTYLEYSKSELKAQQEEV